MFNSMCVCVVDFFHCAGIDYKNKVITLEEENIKLQIW